MLTRWMVTSNDKLKDKFALNALKQAPTNPGIDNKLDWPSRKEIIDSQCISSESPPEVFSFTESGLADKFDKLWIPQADDLLKSRIIIGAHTGHGGHRGQKITFAILDAHFFWKNMEKI